MTPGAAGRLEIVPAFRDEVCAFVDAHHRHHGRPTGYIVAAAVADEAGRVVGVYTLARPSARPLQDGWTVEVTRTCTDGTRNANSCLYGSAWRAAQALGYRRAVTYTQDGETGASLRAAGWLPVAELPARPGWDTPGRRRDDSDYVEVGRTRWEKTAGVPPWRERPRVVVASGAEAFDLFTEEASRPSPCSATPPPTPPRREPGAWGAS